MDQTLDRFNISYDENGRIINCSEYLPNYHHPSYAYGLNLFLFLLYYLYVIITLIIFLHKSRTNVLLKKKHTVLITLSSIGGLIVSWMLIRESVGRDRFSCIMFAFFAFISVPLTAMPIVARIFIFYNRFVYSKKLNKLSLESLQEAQFLASLRATLRVRQRESRENPNATQDTSNHPQHQQQSEAAAGTDGVHPNGAENGRPSIKIMSQGSVRRMLSDMGTSTRFRVLNAARDKPQSHFPLKSKFKDTAIDEAFGATAIRANDQKDGSISLARLSDINSVSQQFFGVKLTMAVIVPFFIAFLVSIPLSGPLRNNCTGCVARQGEQTIVGVEVIIIFCFSVLAICRIRDASDPLHELRDMKLAMMTGALITIIGIIISMIDPNRIEAKGIITYSYFSVVGVFVLHNIQVVLPLVRISFSTKSLWRMVKENMTNPKSTRQELPDYGFWTYNRKYYGDNTDNNGAVTYNRHRDDNEFGKGFSTLEVIEEKEYAENDVNLALTDDGSKEDESPSQTFYRYGQLGPNGEQLNSALDVLLHDATGSILFEEYVTSEFSPEGPRFIQACEKWVADYDSATPKQRYKNALSIYSLFIFEGSILQVNIRSEFRAILDQVFSGGFGPNVATRPSDMIELSRMAGKGSLWSGIKFNMGKKEKIPAQTPSRSRGSIDEVLEEVYEQRKKAEEYFVDLSKDLFDDARDEIFMLMAIDSYPRFIESSKYEDWLKSDPLGASRFPKGPGNRLILAPSVSPVATSSFLIASSGRRSSGTSLKEVP